MIQMFYVYLIQSTLTKQLYVGYTADIEARLVSHNAGNNKATKHGVPWKIIYIEGFRSQKDA